MGDVNLEIKLNNLNEKVIKNNEDVTELGNKIKWSLKGEWINTFELKNSEIGVNEVKEFLIAGGKDNILSDHIIICKSSYNILYIYHTNNKTLYTIDESKNAIFTLENSCLVFSKG